MVWSKALDVALQQMHTDGQSLFRTMMVRLSRRSGGGGKCSTVAKVPKWTTYSLVVRAQIACDGSVTPQIGQEVVFS